MMLVFRSIRIRLPHSQISICALATLWLVGAWGGTALAEVQGQAADGFIIKITKELDGDKTNAYKRFIEDFGKWYDARHSYSGKPENLSLDLEQRCMLEKLDKGGFVRHMEIVYHQPDNLLRMTGGLGPLQGMGVNGAMTVQFTTKDGKTSVLMTYIVTGSELLKLDRIAPAVNQVLTGQFNRFQAHCKENP